MSKKSVTVGRTLRSAKPDIHYHLTSPVSEPPILTQPISAERNLQTPSSEQPSAPTPEEEEEPPTLGEPLQINFDAEEEPPVLEAEIIIDLDLNQNNQQDQDQDEIEDVNVNMAEERTLIPNPFRGAPDEDASEFWRRLDNYLEFKGVAEQDNAARLRLAKPMFVETACDWFENLDATKKDTYAHLKEAFSERYIQPSILRFRSAKEIFDKKQTAEESVDMYVNRLRNLSKKVNVDDQTKLYALLSGLKPQLATFVLGKNPQTFAEGIEAARIAEFSLVETSPKADHLSEQMVEMRKDLQRLAQRYDSSASLNAAIQKDRPKSPVPRVRFQEPRQSQRIFRPRGPCMTNPYYGEFNSYNQTRGPIPAQNQMLFQQPRPFFETRPQQQLPPTQRCNKCGRNPHTNVMYCPAINKQCLFCGKFGHFRIVCRQAKLE